MAESTVAAARRIAEELLFPRANETDMAPRIPQDILDALAEAGLFGITAPPPLGGGATEEEFRAVARALASGSLATAFVWIQHHSAVRALSQTRNEPLRQTWLPPLCRGERRAAVAFSHLRRPGTPLLTATDDDGHWRLRGTAPWVTAWGMADVVYTGAVAGDHVAWLLVDAAACETLTAEPIPLAAVAASNTVTLAFRHHPVPQDRMVGLEPMEEWRERDSATLARNGSLALGVADRCLELLGDGSWRAALERVSTRLAAARDEDAAAARAAASLLALDVAAATVVAGGASAVRADATPQRLLREAMFLLVFAQNPSIRSAQRSLLVPQ